MIRKVLTAALALAVVPVVQAEVPYTPAFNGIMLHGRNEAVVAGGTIRLGDVADIMSPRAEDNATVERLRSIEVATSPRAGDTLRLEGTSVLQRLASDGIDLNSVRYSFPRELTVTRSFREVQMVELEQALSSFLAKNPKPIEVKKIALDRPIKVPSDSVGVEVVALETTRPGHIGIDYKAVSASDDARFQLRASVDSWRMLPVAAKPIKRGTVVNAEDIKLVKVNDAASNRDAIDSMGDILGHAITHDLGQGEVFRANGIELPAVVTAGSKVSLIVRNGRLEVTASGIAVESGAVGQQVKVQNESSKKVVSGKVEGPGVVVVGAY